MNPAGAYGAPDCTFNRKVLTLPVQVLERFFSRKERARLFRSWAGSASLWVKVTFWFRNLLLVWADRFPVGWRRYLGKLNSRPR